MGVIRWEQNVKNKKGVIQRQEVWKWGVNVVANTRHVFLGSDPPVPPPHHSMLRCCERNEQTAWRFLSSYNINLGERECQVSQL